jgi:hypothetical protein
MGTRWIAALALIAALGMFTPGLMADHGQAKGKKKPHVNKVEKGSQGWERRGNYEYRTYGPRDERPPGWDRGNKTGWRDCGLPPGQAKKYGCRTYVYEGRRLYYYQDDRGRIIVRRPVIEIHGSVDIVH